MSKGTTILGISAYYHDSAAAVLRDGEIVAACQEERFTRIKGDASFPHHAIAACLDQANIDEGEVDYIIFYENPFTKFERLLTSYHLTAPNSLRSYLAAMPNWLTDKLWLESQIAREMGIKKRIYFCDHHLSHAASAFFPSPFDKAAILTIDGVGEWSTTTYGRGHGNSIDLKRQLRFPNSLGLLYSAFTSYTGFKINSGEYKMMGLAPYGTPKYADCILDQLIRLKEDGSFVLNLQYFDYVGGLTMTNERFHNLFGGAPREPETSITQRIMDLAASIQVVLEKIILHMARHIRRETGMKDLVMAGGVALNVVAAGKISSAGVFDQLWIQPASGDAGGALGAALWMWYQQLGNPREADPLDAMRGAFLGVDIPPTSKRDDEILLRLGAEWEVMEEGALQEKIAAEIAAGKVVAIARGRAEYGPRALGARSILGDARLPEMQKHMNLKIKFRESFRPFAPMVLEEYATEYFEARQASPYMLLVYPVQPAKRKKPQEEGLWGLDLLKVPRSEVPAITHVDYSARLQTVDKERHPFVYGVLQRFHDKTGCPVVVNTSFNVRGEPIVNTAAEAYRCFMATEIDSLVIGDRFFERDHQRNRPLDETQRLEWLGRFDLD
jgi:carbamoyltransferase